LQVVAEENVNWNAIYLGAAYGRGKGEADLIFNTRNEDGHFWDLGHDIEGSLWSGQIGIDRQMGRVVLGVFGDYQSAGFDGSRRNPQDGSNFIGVGDPVDGPPVEFETELGDFGTVQARAGFLVHERVLAYVHGGVAFGEFRLSGSGGPANDFVTQSSWETGYVAGVGLEVAVTRYLSLFADYTYLDFADSDLSLIINDSDDYTGGVNNQGRDLWLFKFGANLKLSGFPF
jgi:outer membrane immunogenic protein